MVVIHGVVSVLSLLYLYPSTFKKYELNLSRGINTYRWVEYSILPR